MSADKIDNCNKENPRQVMKSTKRRKTFSNGKQENENLNLSNK